MQISFIMKDGRTRRIAAQEGLSLMEIAQQNGIEEIEGACGGGLACATCHLYVHPDWWDAALPAGEEGVTEEEEDMLDLTYDLRKTSRLCCQIKMTAALDGLVVAVPGARTGW